MTEQAEARIKELETLTENLEKTPTKKPLFRIPLLIILVLLALVLFLVLIVSIRFWECPLGLCAIGGN
jgi:hypothetical protein